jgi:signal transduction histidine kinase/ActR/RegA family two-component response regulator
MTGHPVQHQLRALLWWIAGCMALLVLAYAVQVYLNQRDRRTLNDFHGRGTLLALSMHDAYVAARARPGAIKALTPAEEGPFAAATTVALGRTSAYGEQLLVLYTGNASPPFDAARRRLERALAQLRALRAEFAQDDLALAREFSTRPLYIGIVSLQLGRLHTIATKELSAGIERRTRHSSLLFIALAAVLLAALAIQSRRHLRAIETTLRREAETMDALRRSEARLEEAQRVAQLGSWELDPASGSMTLSAQMGRMLGLADGAVGTDRATLLAAVHPEDRDQVSYLLAAPTGDGGPAELVCRLLPAAGPERVVHLHRSEAGEWAAYRSFGTAQDITERRAMETHLLHAQKMESIGRLAGGVAHDFNNLLTAITANLEIALLDSAPGDPRVELLTEAAAAANSAAQVTSQLLTFSRRQVIAPEVLDLNDVIAKVRGMLQRLIGEDVQLLVVPQQPLSRVRIDPMQIEQILVNLAVNARDAMPRGGRLTIETADLTRDGEFVMVAVSDQGQGLSAEDKAHLFEPFYTTKAIGRGTGLGLPMVYGAVQQHGGTIEVQSEDGTGTTFRIYLPRVDEDLPAQKPAHPRPAGGGETIVVVEDEEAVRMVTTRLLRRWGYAVHAFETAEDALAAVAVMEGPIHLLITDVVLPNMNGRMLAERVRARRPGISVLFSSGYPRDLIAHHGVVDPGIEFLAKPYTSDALAARVRQVLDGRAAG